MIKSKVEEVMAKKGIRTQKELAEISGLTRNTINNIATGKSLGSPKTLDALCQALDCQPGDLLVYIPNQKGTKKK